MTTGLATMMMLVGFFLICSILAGIGIMGAALSHEPRRSVRERRHPADAA